MKNYKSLFQQLVLGQWPNIKAKNASGPSATDGTPYTDDVINDIWGFMQDTMHSAGFTPNGQSEEAGSGQILQAIESIILNKTFYVGSTYTQGPGDYTPNELKAMGKMPQGSLWELWNHRANQYGLISGSLPAHTVYNPGNNYGAGAYVMWHLDGDNWGLFKAIAAITNAADQLDPILWEEFQPAILVDRKDLQDWADSDYDIGDTIPGDLYNGWTVCKIEVLGGKFESVAGGNRPPFGSGTQGDMIRNIYGRARPAYGNAHNWSFSGALFNAGQREVSSGNSYNSGYAGAGIGINAELAVPTGPENSVRTASSNKWLRVA